MRLPTCRRPPAARTRLPLGAAIALLAGCTSTGPAYGPPSNDVASVVHTVNNLAFEPATVRIEAGQTVEWRNTSLFTHTVTLERTEPAGSDGAQPPDKALSFREELPPGQIFRHTFGVPGTYWYICEPHDWLGMQGQVIVADAM